MKKWVVVVVALMLCTGCVIYDKFVKEWRDGPDEPDPQPVGGNIVVKVGKAENIGPAGVKPSVDCDSKNQPHVVVLDHENAGSWKLYDKVGTWRSKPFVLSQHYTPAGTINNPHLEVHRATDRLWISGIMVKIGDLNGCGIGMVTRGNVADNPSAIVFSRRRLLSGQGWESGNQALHRDKSIIWVNLGVWEKVHYATGIQRVSAGNGALFPRNLGERPTGTFRISSNVWHAAYNGHPQLPGLHHSGYRNSTMPNEVAWVDAAIYPGTAEDNYVGLGIDLKNPKAAYIAIYSYSGLGIIINVWNGQKMCYPIGSPLSVPGHVDSHRWSPQWSPAINGGAWLCYTHAGHVNVRYISPSGVAADPIATPGTFGTLATDSNGHLHLVYMNNGRTYYRYITTRGE